MRENVLYLAISYLMVAAICLIIAGIQESNLMLICSGISLLIVDAMAIIEIEKEGGE